MKTLNTDELFKKLDKSPTLRKEFKSAKEKVVNGLLRMALDNSKKDLKIRKQLLKDGRRKFINDSIIAYRSWYNAEYIEHLKYIKDLRQIQANKFASTKDNTFRLLLKVPSRLHEYLNRYLDPPFPQDNKEVKWFAKKFRIFCVAECI